MSEGSRDIEDICLIMRSVRAGRTGMTGRRIAVVGKGSLLMGIYWWPGVCSCPFLSRRPADEAVMLEILGDFNEVVRSLSEVDDDGLKLVFVDAAQIDG